MVIFFKIFVKIEKVPKCKQMYSIIDYFDKNGLKYAVTSTEPLSSAYEPNNSFSKSTSFFASYVWPNYWQITFEGLVKIDSYIISLPSISWTITDA